MAPRPQWKGYLKLSLVSCAVALFPASSTSTRTRFHTLNEKTGHRVRRQFVDAETGETVGNEQQVRGYEIGKGSYVLVDEEELDSVALESTHTIEIDRFVKRNKVDQRFLDTPYYLAPNDNIAQQAFAIIRDAMQRKGVVGLARVVLHRRERLLMLEPYGTGMLATVLRYNYEVRDAKPYFEDIAAADMPGEMLDLAAHIIDTKTGEFRLEDFQDRYENALVALLREKQKGHAIVKAPPPERAGNVVNLMEALRLSLGGDLGKAPRAPAPAEKAATPSRSRVPAKQKGRSAKPKLRKAG